MHKYIFAVRNEANSANVLIKQIEPQGFREHAAEEIYALETNRASPQSSMQLDPGLSRSLEQALSCQTLHLVTLSSGDGFSPGI